MVQFTDGSVKAQLGLPDMKLPIQYALAYPQRLPNTFKRIDFATQGMLTFQQPDYTTFENLALAKKAMITGGNAPCALNAANEIAVEAFLEDKINFLDMPRAIAHVLDKIPHIAHPSIDDYRHTDTEARRIAQEYITQ